MSVRKKFYEDFPVGFSHTYAVAGLTSREIMAFAALYDPQRFHLDEEEAADTHFGSLVASGFQTQLLCFRPFCENVLLDTMAVGAPGIDSLKWHRPWYPGESLDVTVKLVDKRLSSSRTDRGYLTFNLLASCKDVPTLEMDWSVIFLTRSPNQKS